MDLSLVPVQELYTEILNRFDHVAIVGLKIKDNSKDISRRWKGDPHTVSGLCSDVSHLALKEWFDNQEEIPTEDL